MKPYDVERIKRMRMKVGVVTWFLLELGITLTCLGVFAGWWPSSDRILAGGILVLLIRNGFQEPLKDRGPR